MSNVIVDPHNNVYISIPRLFTILTDQSTYMDAEEYQRGVAELVLREVYYARSNAQVEKR